MKIQRTKSRTYKSKTYFKHRIELPTKALEKAGFKDGDNLTYKVKKGEIKLRKNGKKEKS